MTVAEFITHFQLNTKRSDLSAAQHLIFANLAMRKLERKYNFPHMDVRTTVALVADDSVKTNPIPAYKNIIWAKVKDGDGKYWPISRNTVDFCMQTYPNLTTDKGRPQLFAFLSTVVATLSTDLAPVREILFRPTCDAAYTFDLYARQFTVDMVSGGAGLLGSNWWTTDGPEILLDAAMVEFCKATGDFQGAAIYAQSMLSGLDDLIGMTTQEDFSGSMIGLQNPYMVD